MKALVLAEKPSVGKDIARVLQCKSGSNGYLEGKQHVVTWALGHLVTLADPEKYHEKYKNWNMDHLPILPPALELVVIKETAKQYKTVKDLLHRKDISEIIIATDAGREGELVARWILEKANCKKPIRRLWISSVTDQAIQQGFKNLKDGKNYVNLSDSAKARAEADWLVGINATRCLTTKYNSQLSCGRVQTPTIAMIAKREEEIKQFKPRTYYGITAMADGFQLFWLNQKQNTKSFDKDKISEIFDSIRSLKEASITEIHKTKKKVYPPKLYDLTELQRDANKRYGFSPKETLSIMQKLYEQHKVLTYPRTDSRYISTDIVSTLPERLKACAVPAYAKYCLKLLAKPIQANGNFVDNQKVSDHHAIIPTEQSPNLFDFNDKERKIYDLVITRFLSVLMPPCEYEQTKIELTIGGHHFITQGKTMISAGFKEMNSHSDDTEKDMNDIQEQMLPSLQKGNKVPLKTIVITEGKTKPPSLFNEATLLSAMENPSKYMDSQDHQIAKTLGETGGLGTVATRADIIDKLFDAFYIEKKGKDIVTTSKGRQLLKLAPKDLRSPELTGSWELKLAKIANGQLKKSIFLNEIRTYTETIIQEIKKSTEVFLHDNLSTTRCPECNKLMLEVNGKKGKMLVCQDRECNTRKNVSLKIRARCPHCHKQLEIIGDGDKKRVNCVCGYRENYQSFSKRKKEEGNALSKKDVQQFLKKMNNQDSKPEKNNAIAEALKGLKL